MTDEWPKLIRRLVELLPKKKHVVAICRWMSGWRRGNLVIDGISWRYRHRKGCVEGVSAFCRECECALKVGYANIGDRRLHPCWMCPKCKKYFKKAEANDLASRARSEIERSLAAPAECRR